MKMNSSVSSKGLMERLKSGEFVLVAEGYVFAMERRGYLKAGAFVPEVLVEDPERVRQLYQEFVHAGSDVVLAFTYYAHREKLSLIGREHELEPMNRTALRMARQVANETGTLMAGNVCNTNIYSANADSNIKEKIRKIFKEQVVWAVEEGADFIVAETFNHLGEALLALEVIQTYGNGLPAVVTMGCFRNERVADVDKTLVECCVELENAGAQVVGLNCGRGPKHMLPLVRELRRCCKGPIAALPVPYRTTDEHLTMISLVDEETGQRAFPDQLDPHLCSRNTVATFARQCQEIGVQYLGLCCGNSAGHLRAMAEAIGRRPPASTYSPDMSLHWAFGTHPTLKELNITNVVKDLG